MSNGLNVTVDVGALIAALRRSNPQMDLTSVKAYLLDMALAEADGETSEPSYKLSPETMAPEIIPTQAAPEDSAPKKISLPGIPEGVLGVERSVSRASVPSAPAMPRVTVKRGTKGTSEEMGEKERKRAEMAKLTSMDSKTILQQMTAGQGRRNEHNQLTDEGFDGPSAGGDLEIG